MRIKTISPELSKIKVVTEEADYPSGYLEGYASVFGNTDLGGDVVEKGAFSKTIRERLGKGMVKMLDSHLVRNGASAVIGLVTELKEDDYGLWFKGRFSSVPSAQEVRTKITEGILNALSFGYDVMKFEPQDEGKRTVLKELKLYEISVVSWGMNPKAAPTVVKQLEKDLEEFDPDGETPSSPSVEDVAISAFAKGVAEYASILRAKRLQESIRALRGQ